MTERGKLATTASVLAAANISYDLIDRAWARYTNKYHYHASVDSEAYVYEPMMLWLNEVIKPRKVTFQSRYDGVAELFDASGSVNLYLNGHKLRVTLQEPNINRPAGNDVPISSLLKSSIVFSGRSRDGIDALYKKLEQLTETKKRQAREVRLWNPEMWHWNASIPGFRDIDSIILPDGDKENLMEDIERFLSNSDYYHRAGIPWHRGYLFHGPPGNGKTSMVAGLAHYYKMDLYNLPLSSVEDDKHLTRLISMMEANSILLFEDIDIFSKSMKRTQENKGPTLAGLLNALDGVSTPNGLLTFMSTNRPEALEPALVRPGRVDFKLEFAAPDEHQISTMFEHVYGEPLNVNPQEFESVAALANIIKTHPFDAESARLEIKA